MVHSEVSLYESSAPQLTLLLRRKLRDSDYMRRAFTLNVNNGNGSACAEIRNKQLRISTQKGNLSDLTIDLAGVDTDTLGGLAEFLTRQTGYRISANEELDQNHPATDLRIKGNGDLSPQRGGESFYHRIWSDEELHNILQNAASRHNMNYTLETVPVEEHQFVVTLAAAEAMRELSMDGVKRRGLSFEVQQCLDIASELDRQYDSDRSRQQRAVPVARIKDTNVEGGDVVQGTLFRRSMRTGYMRPLSSQESPEQPELFVAGEEDVADTQVRVNWRRVRDVDFYAMELWRDTVPDVRRSQQGNVTGGGSECNVVFPTTSKLVYAPRWANSRYYHSALAHHGYASGQVVNNFVDGLPEQEQAQYVGAPFDAPPPEPETVYYYRLFVMDINREVVGSEPIEVRTKPLRAKFSRDNAIVDLEPTTGPIAGGTACTIRGTRFHEGMRVRLGDKPVENLVVVSDTEATFDSPEVFNEQITERQLDVTIQSDTGLEDAKFQAWRYTTS